MMLNITNDYSKANYIEDVENYTLEQIWDAILEYVKTNGETELLKLDNFGELYELGLSIKDKDSKKENGVFYTPLDVAHLLADFFMDLYVSNSCICDVCTGTGNLILSVLSLLDDVTRQSIFENKLLYLYEMDALALKITLNKIGYLYGYNNIENINVINADFLDRTVVLPSNSYVISNPPYYKITDFSDTWCKTKLMETCKEYYAVFMEKCIAQSKGCVFITPFSFVGGSKFKELRLQLNNTESQLFVFDNVPGNIFKGKKYGISNTNTANSTRACISVINTEKKKGCQVTPMMRFATAERSKLLDKSTLLNVISNSKYQLVTEQNSQYYKCQTDKLDMFLKWKENEFIFYDLLSETPTEFVLYMPTTCRYFTTASFRCLNRTGKYTLYFKDKYAQAYAYILLNSSFAYWYWRIYDGAILYPLTLLYTIPINFDSLTLDKKEELLTLAQEIAEEESKYLVYKKNANQIQENIKFDMNIRYRFNEKMIEVLNLNKIDFDTVHSSCFFKVKLD